eukprot:1950215-Prymnesium_polylepis.1
MAELPRGWPGRRGAEVRGVAALLLVAPAYEHGCPRRSGREHTARKRSRSTHRRHATWRRRQSCRG